MKPAFFAVFTALCWSVGAFFEKRGLGIAGLPPIMGITIRTGIAIIILGIFSYPHWHTLSGIGTRPLLYLVLGGGVLAGSLGMLFFYTAIGTGKLSLVMPIAFGLTPLLGFLMGVIFLKEPPHLHKIIGVLLVSFGVFMITR